MAALVSQANPDKLGDPSVISSQLELIGCLSTLDVPLASKLVAKPIRASKADYIIGGRHV